MAKKTFVSFDLSGLSSGAARYRQYSEELESIKEELEEAMNALVNTYWVGVASNKFRNIIGNDWLDTTKRYSELLYDLTMVMDDVVKTYDDLLEQAVLLQIR